MELLKKKKDKKPKANGIELNVDTTGMSEEEIAAMEAAKVLEQYDRESAFRNGLPKGISLVISAILIAFALFQIYTSIWTIPAQVLRSVHLAFALTLVFLLYPAGKHMAKNKVQWYDYVLAILAVAGAKGFVALVDVPRACGKSECCHVCILLYQLSGFIQICA